MGDYVNILIDDLWMVLLRVFDLPLAFQAILWVICSSIFWLLTFATLGAFKKSPIQPTLKIYTYTSSTIFFLIIGAIAINDYQLHKLEVDSNVNKQIVVVKSTSNNSFYFETYLASLKKMSLGKVQTIDYLQTDDGLEIIKINISEPLNVVFLATVDLTKYNVELDTAISVKLRTAKVAKKNDWDIAVNGEAGTAPAREAPLGSWIGNFIVDGNPILLEDTKYRPFIYFDSQNKVYYSKEDDVIKKPTEQMHNAIWGRFDMMLNGESAISKNDYTADHFFPRTLIGINKEGNRLFMMVVDGRKPLYSIGVTMAQAVEVFKTVGVYDAMACDQGGSSLMYSKKLGVVNRPSDGGERAVYTHLGFKRKLN
jgi:exopolysaccharide biosynthesis protein